MGPNAKTAMKALAVPFLCATLMKQPASSNELQRLAGSLVTLLTGMPVISEISDDNSGSYGHVNIVIPRPSRLYRADQTFLELESGVAPSDTTAGDYSQK